MQKREPKETGEAVKVVITGVDEIRQETAGRLFERNGFYYLLYEEALDGCEETLRSRLKCKEGYLALKRQGAVQMELILEEGKAHQVQYATPQGSLLLTMQAQQVHLERQGRTLTVTANYSMGQGDWVQPGCALRVEITGEFWK